MKFLLCCENYPPSVGGVQEVMRQIAERLAAKGHDVSVATGTHPVRASEVMKNGVRVYSFPVSGGLVQGLHGPVEAYRRFVVGGDFDAIMIKAAQQWSFDALIPVLDEIKVRKVFIPCGFSGFYQAAYRDYYRQMPGWMSRFNALVFYATDYQDIRLAREHGLSGIEVLPNGADEREFGDTLAPGFRAELGIGDGNLLFLTVGSINGAKGHWEVARAFELARLDRPATLILNGNRPRRSRKGLAWQFLRESLRGRVPLASLVRRINARQGPVKRVIMSDLPRPDLVRAFKASDLFVFASHVEYSPLVLFEAVAAGTPFLATPAGNAEEIVRWTGGGVICAAPRTRAGRINPDPVSLALEIEQLVTEKERLQNLGQAGRRAFVDNGFSWASIVDRYESILCGMASPGVTPSFYATMGKCVGTPPMLIGTSERDLIDCLPSFCLPPLHGFDADKVQDASVVPSVSWLLCTHVADNQLRQALHSCLDQTFTDFELLVVANGPSAADVAGAVHAWIGGDPRVRIFTTEVRHLIFSLSLGLHHARAELIARMDSDDLSKSYRLARQVAFMQQHPEVVVLGSAYEIIDAGGRPLQKVQPPTSDIEIRRALLRGNPLCHPSVMFRRRVVLDAGGYLGGLHAEDYDLWVRLSNDPVNQFANLDEVCLGYRSVGVGTARRSRSAYASMAASQFRNFINGQGLFWAFAALLSTLKAFIRSSPDRRISGK
jgi:glycosyltransferase involved in cell wall biosynthesis